jgi:hypothetical protein
MARSFGWLARSFGIAVLFLSAALLGTAGGVVFAFVGDLPQIEALDDYSPGTIASSAATARPSATSRPNDA